MITMSSLIQAALFVVVSSPEVYKLTRSIGGGWIATHEGCPKFAGLVLHAIVFVLLLKLIYKTLGGGSNRKSNYQAKMEGYHLPGVSSDDSHMMPT